MSIWKEPLRLDTTDLQRRIVQGIKEKVMEWNNDITILHISITGSRGKGMASDNSDFDTKVLILHSRKDYLLQTTKDIWTMPEFSLEENDDDNNQTKRHTDYNDEDGQQEPKIEVEGLVMDYRKLSEYIQTSNMTAYEFFAGTPIYTTRASMKLRELWCRSYDNGKLFRQYWGMLHTYRKRNNVNAKMIKTLPLQKTQQSGNEHRPAPTIPNKQAMEIVYLSLKVMFLHDETMYDMEPPFHVNELLNASKMDDYGMTKEWIYTLLKERISNKDGDFVVTPPFIELSEAAFHIRKPIQQQGSKEEKNNSHVVENQKKQIKMTMDGIFLSLLDSAVDETQWHFFFKYFTQDFKYLILPL